MALIAPGRALAVARAGAARLAAMVEPSGRFLYRYALNDPTFTNTIYGDVRHVAAVWTLADCANEAWDIPELPTALDRGAAWMEERIFHPYGATEALCVLDEGFIKLGGSAIGVAAELRLAERGSPQERRTRALRLARYVVSQREADGDFLPARVPGPIARPHPARDDFVPGQGIFALALMAEATGDASLLDLAIDSADRFAARDYLVGRVAHWMLYGLEALDRVAPDDSRLAYAGRIAAGIDSLADPDQGMALACVSEGLLAYARTLRRRGGREKDVAAVLTRVGANLRRQLRFFHPSGAFIMSAQRQEVRIDGIAHNILGFLGYARLVEER